MPDSFWLVIAGGLVGLVSGVVPLLLQHRWDGQARRRAADAKALEAAVAKMMAWQDYAVKTLGGSDTGSARQRLVELNPSWEADFGLIPDQDATREILALSRDIFFFGGESPDRGERMNRLIALQDRAILSAQQKRRELA
jgi:hypothetical protein